MVRPRSNRPIIEVGILPGEPTNGSGRVCIHLFVPDVDQSAPSNDQSSYIQPHMLHPVIEDNGEPRKDTLEVRPTRGRLACGARIIPPTKSLIKVVHRVPDPRAVTCPKCIATESYKVMMAKLESR